MKIALLGVDEETLAVAKAAVAAGHVVTRVWQPDGSPTQLAQAFPAARITEDWEALLDSATADVVLVARSADAELQADQLRKLVQSGATVLTSHPLDQSMLVYFELDMIRAESSGQLLPLLSSRLSPATARLKLLASEGESSEIGVLEQVVFERSLSDRSKPAVLQAFARDVDLIRAVCGEVIRVGAMGASAEDSAYANLGVQMAGNHAAMIRWSSSPADPSSPEAGPGGRLTLLGSVGKAVLTMPERGEFWTLQSPAGEQQYSARQLAELAVEQVVAGKNGQQTRLDWRDAARSVELAETVQRSLKKGRTIELHHEEFSESGTFKGLMTSLGCGLLMAGLVLLILVAVGQQLARSIGLDGLADALGFWPYLLLALLLSFLLLQGLLGVARRQGD